ncbi:MAG: ribbon-helix-helix domain-containing protein [Candidatus Diapherotrites archaeon]|nr:ribbon-helix-helix domain-containing protein [Candidatus Diapherotrites archaeon]
MEYVSFRLEKNVLRQIDRGMKESHYSTKSDFLRDAVREKLKKLEKEKAEQKAWEALFAMRGKFKGLGKAQTEEEWQELREKAGEEFMEYAKKQFASGKKYV